MKKFKLSALLTLFAMALFIFSCGEHDHSHDEDGEHAEETSQSDENAEVDLDSKEYASAFICPMHCEGSGGDAAGACPVCGMDYVANENHKSDSDNDGDAGHSEEDHDGHDHDNHEGHNH